MPLRDTYVCVCVSREPVISSKCFELEFLISVLKGVTDVDSYHVNSIFDAISTYSHQLCKALENCLIYTLYDK